ncbi:MAG: ABC transporter ATP-binding protein [Spirochaetia bacterium]|jgi:oligopeptide/dipeptide ABC transporter ATP-binding protein|nr:ABC transporter ATP-binding protein [Spirochaetia bacterium]
MMDGQELLRVEHLSKWFPQKRGIVERFKGGEIAYLKAVDDVSFVIKRGENLGLVGESGCGKSTLAKCILRLIEPTKGQIFLEGTDITALAGEPLRKVRPRMQMIFQDPYSSLNPRMSVYDTIAEVLKVHHAVPLQDIPRRVGELLDMCGLSMDVKDRYPGEFSGGQRQRVGIARAIALNPSFIVADEPVSALDVSIQAQILNLLDSLQQELNQTLLFISHDLQVIRHITTRVEVMYLGSNMELGRTEDVFSHPAHPYTEILMKATPSLDPRNRKEKHAIDGEPPSPIDMPSGCKFHTRCPYCKDKCKTEVPQMKEIGPGHFCACHFPL